MINIGTTNEFFKMLDELTLETATEIIKDQELYSEAKIMNIRYLLDQNIKAKREVNKILNLLSHPISNNPTGKHFKVIGNKPVKI